MLAIWLITGCMTILIRLVPVVEQELHTLLEHLSSPPVFRRVCAIRSLVLYVCFVNRCLSFCPFYFGHCVVCSSSIYRLWLPLCYLPMNAIWNIENLKIWFFWVVYIYRESWPDHYLWIIFIQNQFTFSVKVDNHLTFSRFF